MTSFLPARASARFGAVEIGGVGICDALGLTALALAVLSG
jgi:hypothetical protein